ncbi:metallophosphoesterase family protein [Chengkuizengella axinellae]|uniref:Metallophosphoesterase family protein n=1 Tax=Chengkuizengella axinellae TaxID=3064388 RepID=A0ABT9J527_9BACL|nr:metallophosphoesterase family protein [Chengkuizengella sp. 2205SS18-9]MDP5276730.1 metallophosphoesterase family protein [Chengkuizengella sp. 2205SS18-9]
MDIFIIGDIHGCFYTFKKLLNKLDKDNEILVQVGDLIDRGKNTPQTVHLARNLKQKHPNNVIFLKGNHEFEFIQHIEKAPNLHWVNHCGEETLYQYKLNNRNIKNDMDWFKEMPLFWENSDLFISHAGIAKEAANPFEESSNLSVIWNRNQLKNLNKLQIIGHTPCKEPMYDEVSNSWNIDTGAAYQGYGYLTGVKVKSNGTIIEFLKEKTDVKDII